MNLQEEQELYERSLAHFGYARQWDKLAEEASEVAMAVLKTRYKPDGNKRIAEECVDFLIVLNQVLALMDGDYIERYKQEKLERLRNIVDGKLDVK